MLASKTLSSIFTLNPASKLLSIFLDHTIFFFNTLTKTSSISFAHSEETVSVIVISPLYKNSLLSFKILYFATIELQLSQSVCSYPTLSSSTHGVLIKIKHGFLKK